MSHARGPGRYTRAAASGPASMASQTADIKPDPDAPQMPTQGMFAAGNTLGTPAAAGGNRPLPSDLYGSGGYPAGGEGGYYPAETGLGRLSAGGNCPAGAGAPTTPAPPSTQVAQDFKTPERPTGPAAVIDAPRKRYVCHSCVDDRRLIRRLRTIIDSSPCPQTRRWA